jgi:SSS family solute:Na+ symporter
MLMLADVFGPGRLQLFIIIGYLAALIVLGLVSSRFFRGTAVDYFLASRGVGPIVLVLSVFGTTMTAFAIQGSSGEAWSNGIGVYGKLASWSAIVHAACFFLIGVKLWSFGKRYGFQTQIQFFRARFESRGIGLLLFPVLVFLQTPYIIIGIIGAGTMIQAATRGAFPQYFVAYNGAVPFWLGTLFSTAVVWLYVSLGGARATAWANALQTLIFLVVGVITFVVVADKLGGVREASRMVQEYNPTKFTRGVSPQAEKVYEEKLAAFETAKKERTPAGAKVPAIKPHKPHEMPELEFLSYAAIPLSVAMFPHLFQLWLTARSAKTFKLTVTLHPILIMLIWAPCVLIGVWATSAMVDGKPVIPPDHSNPNTVLGLMVLMLGNPVVSGLLAAGVLAAILGGMDAQFLCIGSMFTHDIVDHYVAHDHLTDKQRLFTGRLFVVIVVLVCWLLTLALKETKAVFPLGIWCFSGFSALFPLVFGALYWKRMTKLGAYASILAGIGLGIYFYVSAGLAQGFEARIEPHVWGMVPAVPMVLAATVALVLVSLITRPPSSETVARFFDPPDAMGQIA